MRTLRALIVFIAVLQPSLAFQSALTAGSRHRNAGPRHTLRPRQATRNTAMQTKRSPTGDFELQELKAQIDAMKRQGVASRSLPPTKLFELESYARGIIENKASPVPLEQVGTRLPKTKWQLVFSTENSALADLPRDANVVLQFLDGTNMDYSLQFGEKTAGLNSITAKSTWTAGEGNNREGSYPGLVTIVYDKISCDAFGLKDVGVGFFGLLKGRASYIQTFYFDDEIWIDGGRTADGSSHFSVYSKQDN